MTIAAICLVFIGLCAAGYFGWRQYQYMQTSEYAFVKLKEALMNQDTDRLARLVDFNSASDDLARAIQKNFPFFKEGTDQLRNIKNIIQTAALEKILAKDAKTFQIPANEPEETTLKRDLQILPPDFVSQFINNMSLRVTSPDAALVSTKINNPLLKRDFTLVFSLNRTPQGWIVRHMANSDDVAHQMRLAMLARYARLRTVYEEKNAAAEKQMNEILPIQSCTADAGLLSNGKTLMLVVHVIARNRGNVQVNNFDLDTTITGRSGNVLLHRFLNTAKPVAPGEDFNHRWNFELDGQSDLGRAILGGAPLQCRATWHTLGLNEPRVLHIQEVPNPDRACPIPSHDHPEGFCVLPVFR